MQRNRSGGITAYDLGMLSEFAAVARNSFPVDALPVIRHVRIEQNAYRAPQAVDARKFVLKPGGKLFSQK